MGSRFVEWVMYGRPDDISCRGCKAFALNLYIPERQDGTDIGRQLDSHGTGVALIRLVLYLIRMSATVQGDLIRGEPDTSSGFRVQAPVRMDGLAHTDNDRIALQGCFQG